MRVSFIITAAAVLAEVSLAQYTHQLEWISRHLVTRSPYPIPSQLDNITVEYEVDQIQLVIRHGTRYAKKNAMQGVNEVLERLHESDNIDALSWLHDYEPMDLKFSSMIDNTGRLDMYLHGQRVAKVQSKLLDSMIQKDVVFDLSSYSDKSVWTSESGLAFHQGLLEGRGPLGSSKQLTAPFHTLDYKTDNIINMRNNCPIWQKEISHNPGSMAESKLYAASVLAAIAQRLSNDFGIEVSIRNVDSIFDGCIFDVAQYRNTKFFCSLLSHDEILQLEYFRDLNIYYTYSYGYPEINTKVACELGQVLYQELQDAYNKMDGYHKLSLKFGHTQSIIFLQSYLGLFKDPFILRANTSQADIDRRVFRTANFCQFAANIGFQLLTRKGTSDRYVRVLVAERPVVMPGCGTELCPYAKFESVMKPLLQCNYEEVCSLSP
ncbi:PHOsphatase [Apophysomyces sp. BC1034]|nr:PHOsphatase [Apophysomyces sp. BC1015]KAG0179251.1 PHOsphatase [Apophysomyces sp. BC1021]KAG0192430.1 PHOsphatase [Apophysomyces sp. BC1034]